MDHVLLGYRGQLRVCDRDSPITIGAPGLTFLWGLILTAAVGLSVAAVLGRFKWEYVTVTLVIAVMGIYAAKVWYYTWFDPSQEAIAALITALALALLMRWDDCRKLVVLNKNGSELTPTMKGDGVWISATHHLHFRWRQDLRVHRHRLPSPKNSSSAAAKTEAEAAAHKTDCWDKIAGRLKEQ